MEREENVATNRENINMNREIVARKLKIFSVDKERDVTGNPPTNRDFINMIKRNKNC